MPLLATTPDAQVRTADAPERSRGHAREDRSTTRPFLGSCGQPAGRGVGTASRTPPRLSRRHTGWRRWRRPRGRGGRSRRGRPRVQSERVHFETCQERPGLMAAGARGKVRQAKVWGHHHRDSERSHLGRQGHPGKEETKGTPTLQRGAGRKRPATAEEPQRRDEGAPTGLAGAGGAAVPRGRPEGPQDQEPQQGGTSAGGCRGHSKAPGVRPTGDSRGRAAVPAPSALSPRPRRPYKAASRSHHEGFFL